MGIAPPAALAALAAAALVALPAPSARAVSFGPDLGATVADNSYPCSFPFVSSPPGPYPSGCTIQDPLTTSMSLVLPDPVVNGNQTGVVTAIHVLSAATAPAQFVVVAWAGTPAVAQPPFPSAVTAVSQPVILQPGLNNFNTNLPVEYQLHGNGFETWSVVSLNILDGSSPIPAQLGGQFSTTGLLLDNYLPLTQTTSDLTIPPHNVAVSGFPPMTLLMSGEVTITTKGPPQPPGGGGGPLGLASPDALVRRNQAVIDLVCAAGGPCPGYLFLQNQPAAGAAVAPGVVVSGAADRVSVAAAKRRVKVVTYGKASFNLTAGETSMVMAKLNPTGRRITRGHRTPTVWANIHLSGNSQAISQQVTLTH